MLQKRVIPCLQLLEDNLVKTIKFNKYNYIGDPVNTVRIFNELEVDELCLLDIRATLRNLKPNLSRLCQIADECFMPLSYGGGIKDIATALEILSIGFEKVIINSAAFLNQNLIPDIASISGSQSIIASIDVKKNLWGKYELFSKSGTQKEKVDLTNWVKELERMGAGEILVTSIDQEGTWNGFDIDLIKIVSDSVNLPIIANGGAGNLLHIESVFKEGHASAVALGSMVVFQKKGMGVLVNFPDNSDLKRIVV